MLNTMTRHRAKRADGDRGFTLIELLVVVVIIGILIAIAIPLYLNYRRGANDKSAQSDLRNAVSVLELCNSDASTGYPSAVSSAGALTGCTGQSINLTANTTVAYYPISATDLTGYIMTASNSGGSGKIYCYNSTKGGSVTTTATAATQYRATC